jgi:hypothetical protein
MAVRPPQSLAPHRAQSVGVLDYEIAQQKAQTLGDLGRQVEQAIAALRAFDAEPQAEAGQAHTARRSALLDKAADRVWTFMVQRELCGLRHWEAVVKAYAIPREVLNRMGQVLR